MFLTIIFIFNIFSINMDSKWCSGDVQPTVRYLKRDSIVLISTTEETGDETHRIASVRIATTAHICAFGLSQITARNL